MWPEIKEYENQHQEIIDSTALKKQRKHKRYCKYMYVLN